MDLSSEASVSSRNSLYSQWQNRKWQQRYIDPIIMKKIIQDDEW